MATKPLRSKQQTLFDIVGFDSGRIPKFINTKRREHREAVLRLQSVYELVKWMAAPDYLSEQKIELIYIDIIGEFSRIASAVLRQKMHDYLLLKLYGYLKTAIEFECYEAAANFKRYLRPAID